MILKKRWGFGLGTLFSLIVIYFIYLYSREKGWALLAFLSKWYLVIIGILIALPLLIIVLVLLFSMLMFLMASIKIKMSGRANKKHKKPDGYINAEYEVKE